MINYSFKTDSVENCHIPDEVRKSIFIPAYGWNQKHYYTYIDFKNKIMKKWNVSYKEDFDKFMREMEVNHGYKQKNNVLETFNFAFVPHSSIIYKNKVFVFMVNCFYFIIIDLVTNEIEQVFDNNMMLISSTNMIVNDTLYYGRYSVEDRLDNINKKRVMHSEIVAYDLNQKTHKVLGEFESCNIIHSVAINPTKEYIIAVSTTARPKVPFYKYKYEYTVEEMKELLDKGLEASEIHVINVQNYKSKIIYLPNSPAHVEFDKYDQNLCYISSHSLGVNEFDGFVYCFGEGAINKLLLNMNSQIIDMYANDDFSRLSTHKLYLYENKQYIAVTVYPQQVHILDSADMSLVKKIKLNPSLPDATLHNGAYRYPRIDRTPFSLHPFDNSCYMFLVFGGKVWVYNHELEKPEIVFNYNINKDPIAVLGHSFIT